MSVCRVIPDVAAVEREFDYRAPDALAPRIEVGTVVRVPLHGRSVRGWVSAVGIDSERAGDLLDISKVSSAGPDVAMVDLCRWASRRWLGPVTTFLRAATAPNAVDARLPRRPARNSAETAPVARSDDIGRISAEAAVQVAPAGISVATWPPLLDRRDFIVALLAPRGSSLVITADLARASALATWLRSGGYDAIVYHSALSAAQRSTAWRRATAGECVVVGGRVAAFCPLPDLTMGIVVDDADEALQEERAPTWHARDVVSQRCARVGVPCVVVGAVPTLESRFLATRQVVLPAAAARRGWPRVQVVDRGEADPGAGLFTEQIVAALRRELDRGGSALCVLNRRGRVRLLACGECRHLLRWDAKGRPVWELTDADGSDETHDRGAARAPHGDARPLICPKCGSRSLRLLRSGVSKLRDDLQLILPSATIGDVDAETADVPEAQILIGTESLLHRAEVRRRHPGMIAFVDFDQELLAPRFRAGEQALHLLARAARLLVRDPRGESQLVVQTRLAEHPVVVAAERGDVDSFLTAELERRRELDMPPLCAIAQVRGEAEPVTELVERLSELSVQAQGVRVLGPAPDQKRLVALVKAPDHAVLSSVIESVVERSRGRAGVRVAVDPPRI